MHLGRLAGVVRFLAILTTTAFVAIPGWFDSDVPVVLARAAADQVAEALKQGTVYAYKRKYEWLWKPSTGDKLPYHTSAICHIDLASVERKRGDFFAALDAERAVKVAGDDKAIAVQAHLIRSTLLTQMAGKPSDKKLHGLSASDLQQAADSLKAMLIKDDE